MKVTIELPNEDYQIILAQIMMACRGYGIGAQLMMACRGYGIGTDISILDLCPSCTKSLKFWFENPYIDEYNKKEVNRNKKELASD